MKKDILPDQPVRPGLIVDKGELYRFIDFIRTTKLPLYSPEFEKEVYNFFFAPDARLITFDPTGQSIPKEPLSNRTIN